MIFSAGLGSLVVVGNVQTLRKVTASDLPCKLSILLSHNIETSMSSHLHARLQPAHHFAWWRCQDRRLGPLSLSRQWNIGNPRSLHIPDSDRQSDAVAKAKGKDPNKRHHTNASSQLLSVITSISAPMHCIGSLFLRRRPAVVVLVILGRADKAATWRTHPGVQADQ